MPDVGAGLAMLSVTALLLRQIDAASNTASRVRSVDVKCKPPPSTAESILTAPAADDSFGETHQGKERKITMFDWCSRRRLAARLAQADATALVRDDGVEAYWEARRRERDVI